MTTIQTPKATFPAVASPTKPAGAQTRVGRYEILARIGVGGMAEVFRARARGPGGYQRNLIIKCILPHLAVQPDFVRAFVDEAKLLGMLNHPNIVGIYDFGQDDGRHYLALEYLDGPTLGTLLAITRSSRKMLPFGVAVFIAREICRGLIAVHSLRARDGSPLNVVHRDVTPSNVMTTTTGAVKLLDFGIAKINGSDNVTRVGQIKGKAGYLAPEQILGGAVDGRVDLFALGIVLYEMLSLQPLFYGEGGDVAAVYRTLEKQILPPSSFRTDTPPGFDHLVMKALFREPAKRYQTATEMELALDDAFVASGMSPDDVAAVLTDLRTLLAQTQSAQPVTPP